MVHELETLQENLIVRLVEMEDKESAFLIFKDEFFKVGYMAEKMLKKIFDKAYKLANNDFELCIRIIIDLLDLLSMFITSNEIFETEKPSKIVVAAYLLKEVQYTDNYRGREIKRMNRHKIEEFASYLDKEIAETLVDIISQRLRHLEY